MRYTLKDFKTEYPDDEACLRAVMQSRYGRTCPKCGVVGTKFYPVSGRKAFVCQQCKSHIYPLADTIFRKSETSLWNWFYVIFQFSTSKNGVSAKKIERDLGVTYKTAWRMCKQVRLLMAQDSGDLFSGDVEADETYIGGKRDPKNRYTNKTAIYGMVERDGRAMAYATNKPTQKHTGAMIMSSVAVGTRLLTDESKLYWRVGKYFEHVQLRHQSKEYVRGDAHTNTIEGFWGQVKRSLDGTHHCVSPKYLQHYVNEYVFRYNYRNVPVFPILVSRAERLS